MVERMRLFTPPLNYQQIQWDLQHLYTINTHLQRQWRFYDLHALEALVAQGNYQNEVESSEIFFF